MSGIFNPSDAATTMNQTLPILYSFRRCPYAMRARIALHYSHIVCEIREVDLNAKPAELVSLSPKATVPVLQLLDQSIIDESMDIIYYALKQHDPDDWLQVEEEDLQQLIYLNDQIFTPLLRQYKYNVRYPESDLNEVRAKIEQVYLQPLEKRLGEHEYLCKTSWSIADLALFPFIRQCSMVEPEWFQSSAYSRLQEWLNQFLASDLFAAAMVKYPVWQEGDRIRQFPAS